MRPNSSFLLALLAASASAAPGSLCKKAACNADNCLRAAKASSAKPGPSSAAADCASFFRKTVTPCAVTTTSTRTVTVTAAPVGVTVTTIAPQTQLNTVVQTLTSVVATVEDTVTLIQPTEVVVPNIIVTAVTVTAAPAAKRAVQNLAPLPDFPSPHADVAARAVSTCPATTNSPTSVPAYASACSGTVRYSSACSCAGYTQATTTLTPATSTATSTSTVTVTPTTVDTLTLTTTVPVTVVATQVIPTTFETTDATLVVPSAYTVTSDVIIATTVVVAPPVCTSYKFVLTSGPNAGMFITGDSPDDSVPYGFVTTDGNAASALSFDIRSDGLVYSSGQDRWITRGNQLYYVLQAADQYATAYNIDNVYCAIDMGASSYPGALGSLTCTSAGHAVSFYSCPSTGNNLVQGTSANSAGYGCTQMDAAAVLAC